MLTATAADTARLRSSRSLSRLEAAVNRRVAADSAAAARIAFGLMVLYSSWRFVAKGWVETLYLAPAHHLTYPGLGWIEPWPTPFMYAHVLGLGLLGIAIAVGYRTRLAAALFVVGFAYVELIDAALYLNHYWFLTLSGVCMVILPVGQHWSLDANRGRVVASSTIPVAVIWVLRAQIAVVYFFAGLAKLNPDWLLEAQPLRLWFADRTTLPVVGALLDEPVTAYLASWGATFFDLTIVGWLLWRRSRPLAFGAVVIFHVFTGWLFPIGVFPWVMMSSTLVFLDPTWPRRLLTVLGMPIHAGGVAEQRDGGPTLGRGLLIGLALMAAVQLVLPLRHLGYEGNVRETEEGYYLAWRVMLTEKAGHVEFRVADPASGRTWIAGPELVLTDWQASQAQIRPDLVHSTAHLLADFYSDMGIRDVEIRADAFVSINGGPAHRFVDPDVNLAGLERKLR